jgi:general secretion pathway protein B
VSLILDALRQADAERERGSVPGLHTQAAPALSADVPSRPRARSWHLIVIGILAGLLLVLLWIIIDGEAKRARGAASVAQASLAPVNTTPAAAPQVDAQPAGSAKAAATAVAAAPPAPSAAERATPITQVAEPAPWPQPELRKPAEGARMAGPAARGRTQTAAAAPAEPPVYSRDQLPAEIRASLPTLAFGGSIYSDNPADRSLIINGRIFRENDRLTAELTLEQIRMKSAVLNYRGYRVEVGY